MAFNLAFASESSLRTFFRCIKPTNIPHPTRTVSDLLISLTTGNLGAAARKYPAITSAAVTPAKAKANFFPVSIPERLKGMRYKSETDIPWGVVRS